MTESDYKKALGRRLAELRRRAGLSQSEVAERANADSGGRLALTQNAISRLELGVRELPLLEGIHLAGVLDTTIEGLVSPPSDQVSVVNLASNLATSYRNTTERIARARAYIADAEGTLAGWREDAATYWRQALDTGDPRVVSAVREAYLLVGLDDIVKEGK